MMPHLTTVQSGLALASVGGAAVLAAIASVLTDRPAPDAPTTVGFTAPDDVVYLVCDATACAHLTRRHTPHHDGTSTCQECGTTRLDHQ